MLEKTIIYSLNKDSVQCEYKYFYHLCQPTLILFFLKKTIVFDIFSHHHNIWYFAHIHAPINIKNA